MRCGAGAELDDCSTRDDGGHNVQLARSVSNDVIPRAPVVIVLLLLSLSGSAASSFGPEVAVTPPTALPSSAVQMYAAAAANGDGFLVAWWENRAQSGVYTARLSAEGTLMDQRDLFVSPTQGTTAMTPLGRDTLLAILNCGTLEIDRISEANTIVDSAKVATSTSVCFSDFSLVTNGETVVVAYGGNVSVFDLDLNLTAQQPIDASAIYGAAATDGRDYVLVSARPSSSLATATRLDHRGSVVESHDVAFPNRIEYLDIESNGTDYLAIAGGPVLGAARLAATGAQLGAPVSVQITSPSRGATDPHIAWGGTAYVVTYREQPQISTTPLASILRVDPDGQVLTNRQVGSFATTNVAVRPGRALLLTTVSFVQAQALNADTLTPVADAKNVSYSTAEQFTPKLVDANGTLVAFWRERRFDAQYLKAKVLADGASEQTLITGVFSDYSVGFDGTNFIVVFMGGANFISAQRFRMDLTPAGVVNAIVGSANSISTPAATAADGRLLVTWAEADGGVYAIKERVFDTTGDSFLVLNTATLSAPPFDSGRPSTAWNGTDFLVMWTHATAGPPVILAPPPPADVFVQRVARDGTVIDAAPVLVASPNRIVSWTALASNGGNFYAVWTQVDPSSGRLAVFGKLIESTLAMDPGNGTFLGNDIDIRANVAPFGSGYVVSWSTPNADATAYAPTLRLIDGAGHAGAAYALPFMPRVSSPPDVVFADGTMAYVRIGTEHELGGALRVFTRTFGPGGKRRAGS